MERMKKWLAVVLFLALTALKLTYPAPLRWLRAETLALFHRGPDAVETVLALGRGLADRTWDEQLLEVFAHAAGESGA